MRRRAFIAPRAAGPRICPGAGESRAHRLSRSDACRKRCAARGGAASRLGDVGYVARADEVIEQECKEVLMNGPARPVPEELTGPLPAIARGQQTQPAGRVQPAVRCLVPNKSVCCGRRSEA
jgi:hypothetical protein